jgi:hypothetical protein
MDSFHNLPPLYLFCKWSPHGLKPVAPPHASRAQPSEAHPTALLKSFVGYPHRIHPWSKEPCLRAEVYFSTQAWLSA